MMKARWMAAAAVGAALTAASITPALADTTSTVYDTQVGTISTVNWVLSPTDIQIVSSWIHVNLLGTDVPVDPPHLML